MSVQAIKEEIKNWDKSQQAELMHFLVELLTNDQFQLSDNWKHELEQRTQALKNGTSVGRPARDVIAKYTAQ